MSLPLSRFNVSADETKHRSANKGDTNSDASEKVEILQAVAVPFLKVGKPVLRSSENRQKNVAEETEKNHESKMEDKSAKEDGVTIKKDCLGMVLGNGERILLDRNTRAEQKVAKMRKELGIDDEKAKIDRKILSCVLETGKHVQWDRDARAENKQETAEASKAASTEP
ncbi:hypothetical protein E4U41_001048 [Claviceps citrina]|nr:hypothetical protein E4U41_001048 [Claviceps citrina]